MTYCCLSFNFIVSTRSPAAAWLHSSQEGAKAAEAMAKVAASNRTWWDRLLVAEHFIEEPAFNVELGASHAKCEMERNSVAALFRTIWDIGINTKHQIKKLAVSDPQKKFFFQSILTNFGSSFIGAIHRHH